MEIFFGLVTTIAFGFDYYFVRKGLIATPYPLISSFITLTINFFFFVVLFLIFIPISLLRLSLIYIFIIAGILAPGLARVLAYKGLETLGMAISAPIINAESLFAVLMAVIFLEEPVNLLIAIGIFSVVTGSVFLSYGTGKEKRLNVKKEFRYRYIFYPAAASILYGVSFFVSENGSQYFEFANYRSYCYCWNVMVHFVNISRNKR